MAHVVEVGAGEEGGMGGGVSSSSVEREREEREKNRGIYRERKYHEGIDVSNFILA